MNKIGDNIYEGLALLSEDIRGWNGNEPIFERLIRKTMPSVIIEVGTWKGQSAINMAKYLYQLSWLY